MRTITLKITNSGMLTLAHPLAKAGPEHLIYAITDVPADVAPGDVARQACKVALVGRHDDAAAWTYAWPEIAGKPHGSIINHYPRAG
jgi:hypothetical protein